MSLYYETISDEMKQVLLRLMEIDEFDPFRLVGGTSLSLQLGHRTSVDVDFFAGGGFNTKSIIGILESSFGKSIFITRSLQNGVSAVINNVKLDIYDWKVPFTKPARTIDGIRLASIEDIFANKCEALIDRRSEKDFCDIGEILKSFQINDLVTTLHQRYPFISLGAVSSILVKESIIVRDETIKLLRENSFEKYSSVVKMKLKEYEESIEDIKRAGGEKRDQKIRDLIEQKRKNRKQ
jgi:predicted nucleotidyltransferase component of viral defense system